jgi:carboxyl-terminal processing protease
MRIPLLLSLSLSLCAAPLASCAVPVDDHAPNAAASAALVADGRTAAVGTPAPAQPADPHFVDSERAFAKAKQDLLETYYREGLDQDELYRAALAGMLERLDPAMKEWNKLLTPAELADLHADLQGQVMGIGVEIKFDAPSGYTDVLSVFAGSAAERAGMLAGDKIVTIDGQLFKGLTLRDVVAHIRGKAGEQVTLSVLRGDKLIPFSVTRELVVLEPVEHLALPGHVGYVHIRGFSAKTTTAVRTALEDLAQQGAQALVVDLRDNQGGSFDEAVATAGLFLPKGATVVVSAKRGKDQPYLSKGDPILGTVPLSVLVNGKTASGAELLAGALQEGRKAQVIGSRTFGKWSVQMLDELGNGYAIKYTVGIFHTAGGRSFQGEGMPPDVEVDMDEAHASKAMALQDPAARVAADMQLRTAVGLFKGR